jgi:hypothetical protein
MNLFKHVRYPRKLTYESIVVDRHRFDADPDPTFDFDADPDPDPTPSFTHIGKSELIFGLLITEWPVYIVLSSSSA